MKLIEWRIVLKDDNKIASIEHGKGLPVDQVESHLIIIGLLENLKQKHLDKIRRLSETTIKRGDDPRDL